MKIMSLKSLCCGSPRFPIAHMVLVAVLLVSLSLAPISWATPGDTDGRDSGALQWVDQLVTWVAQWVFGGGELEEPGQETLSFLDPTTTETQASGEDERSPAIDPGGMPAN